MLILVEDIARIIKVKLSNNNNNNNNFAYVDSLRTVCGKKQQQQEQEENNTRPLTRTKISVEVCRRVLRLDDV